MNKIKLYIPCLSIIGAFFLLSSTSCKKAIEFDEIGGISADSAIRTEANLVELNNSSYFAMAADDYYGGSYQVFNELLADHIAGTTLDGDYLGIYGRNVTIFNAAVSSAYGQMSKGIYQSNLVLSYLNLASTANRDAIAGQAKFVRGLCLFDLVRLYAQPYSAATAATEPGIPLRLSPVRQKNDRKSVAEVYAQIIADLKSADSTLPGTNGVYATKWAAKALLAKVYFQMNDFANAYLYANDVITNGGFVFDNGYTTRYSSQGSSEAIFSLVYEATNTQGRFQRLRGNYNTLGAALPNLRLTSNFYERASATSTDARNIWYSTKNGFFLLNKFDSATIKLPVIHLTEIKLIRAEAAAETGTNLADGIADMNDILVRAYGAGSPLVLPATASAAAIKEAARKQREFELVGEGNWVQELKRRGAKGEAVTIKGSAYNCPGLILPFPSNEINYNGFAQNPSGGCN